MGFPSSQKPILLTFPLAEWSPKEGIRFNQNSTEERSPQVRKGLLRTDSACHTANIPWMVHDKLPRAHCLVESKDKLWQKCGCHVDGWVRARVSVFYSSPGFSHPADFYSVLTSIPCRLGDRHGENILIDTTNGDVVHVDFNCLFGMVSTDNLSSCMLLAIICSNLVDYIRDKSTSIFPKKFPSD